MSKLFTVGADRKLVDRTPDGIGMSMPVGSFMWFCGDDAPASWLLCDGSEVSRTLYTSLFNVIGTSFGSGNGTTTFNLPDFRGRIAKGATVPGDVQKAGSSTGDIDSVGLIPCIKAFGSVVTSEPLVTHSTIIYPNGGSAGAEAIVAGNQRFEMDNPFPGYYVICEPQIKYNNKWGNPGWFDNYLEGAGKMDYTGVKVNQLLPDDKLIVQTGHYGVMHFSAADGDPFNETNIANFVASAPCRVIVHRMGKM